MKKILCAIDLETRGRNALDAAHALARDHGARLILLCVIEPPEVIEGEFGMPPPPIELSDEEVLNRLQTLLPDSDSVEVETVVTHGMPADEIIRVARETNSDLIILGTHQNEDWISSLFHPNVVEQVRRSATCAVLPVDNAPTAISATL